MAYLAKGPSDQIVRTIFRAMSRGETKHNLTPKHASILRIVAFVHAIEKETLGVDAMPFPVETQRRRSMHGPSPAQAGSVHLATRGACLAPCDSRMRIMPQGLLLLPADRFQRWHPISIFRIVPTHPVGLALLCEGFTRLHAIVLTPMLVQRVCEPA